jgi:hypothetical protein
VPTRLVHGTSPELPDDILCCFLCRQKHGEECVAFAVGVVDPAEAQAPSSHKLPLEQALDEAEPANDVVKPSELTAPVISFMRKF